MGASYPDLNRCIYKFTDDRRCRNPISSPGMAHCVHHRDKLAKKSRQPRVHAATPPPNAHAAHDAFMDWLAHHPLDTVTNITRALNQIFVLVAAGRLSPQESGILLRSARLSLIGVKGCRDEFGNRYMTPHASAGLEFLAKLRETLIPAIQADQAAERAVVEPSPVPDAASATSAADGPSDDLTTAAPPLDREDQLNPPFLYTPLPPQPSPSPPPPPARNTGLYPVAFACTQSPSSPTQPSVTPTDTGLHQAEPRCLQPVAFAAADSHPPSASAPLVPPPPPSSAVPSPAPTPAPRSPSPAHSTRPPSPRPTNGHSAAAAGPTRSRPPHDPDLDRQIAQIILNSAQMKLLPDSS